MPHIDYVRWSHTPPSELLNLGQRKDCNAAKGFTLIELLVVIVVIVISVALLLPVLSSRL